MSASLRKSELPCHHRSRRHASLHRESRRSLWKPLSQLALADNRVIAARPVTHHTYRSSNSRNVLTLTGELNADPPLRKSVIDSAHWFTTDCAMGLGASTNHSSRYRFAERRVRRRQREFDRRRAITDLNPETQWRADVVSEINRSIDSGEISSKDHQRLIAEMPDQPRLDVDRWRFVRPGTIPGIIVLVVVAALVFAVLLDWPTDTAIGSSNRPTINGYELDREIAMALGTAAAASVALLSASVVGAHQRRKLKPKTRGASSVR